jgi:hypothetical protein
MATITKEKTAKKDEAPERALLKVLAYSVAESPNAKAADDLISGFYANIKDKFNFLQENFNFQIACGSDGTQPVYEYYSLAIQFILSEARDWGVESIIKTEKLKAKLVL